jgi:hypothetical protein
MERELFSQSFQEGVTLVEVYRRCGRLDGSDFGIVQGERR